MSELFVQIMNGPRREQVVRMTAGGVAFGRSAHNPIHIPLPTVSRMQGEFTLENDGWMLVNHASHGTRVNRRTITDKPRRLKVGDRIYVGDEHILTVLDPKVVHAQLRAAQATDEADASADSPQPQAGGSKRRKLWTGIGVYMLLMLGLFVFFITLSDGEPAEEAQVERLSHRQIAEQIRRPVTPLAEDSRQFNAALAAARGHRGMIGRQHDALYRTYAAYRRAMAHTRQDPPLPAIDQLHYQQAEAQLLDNVTRVYHRGYDQLRAGQHERAIDTLRRVAEMYPADESELYRSVQRMITVSLRAVER